jgi:hypothetical protein
VVKRYHCGKVVHRQGHKQQVPRNAIDKMGGAVARMNKYLTANKLFFPFFPPLRNPQLESRIPDKGLEGLHNPRVTLHHITHGCDLTPADLLDRVGSKLKQEPDARLCILGTIIG